MDAEHKEHIAVGCHTDGNGGIERPRCGGQIAIEIAHSHQLGKKDS